MDDRTGQIIKTVQTDQEVIMPVWKTDEKGQYINYEGQAVDFAHRVPEYDENSGTLKTRKMAWKDIQEDVGKYNKEHQDQLEEQILQLHYICLLMYKLVTM